MLFVVLAENVNVVGDPVAFGHDLKIRALFIYLCHDS